ncbi:MAG: Nramp family divalent metal transporter [Propionibacteriaceae bacterium]|nr:Nramp family divalent metal transporter [Propionibacteriaceae bacterium]
MASTVRRTIVLLGPAFVAAMAYVDPGNVAANISAGAEYGYLLVWALVAASGMAMLIQYLSAKLGVVTRRSLSALVAESLGRRRHGRWLRAGYGVQAMGVAIATDLAEVVGGAIALFLLFGLPLWLGGLIVGVVSVTGLHALRRRGEVTFEVVLIIVLAVIAAGFLTSLVWMPPDPAQVIGGLVPRFADATSIQLAAAILGATVMPHAIYLHSALAKQRHAAEPRTEPATRRLLRVQKVDVIAALIIAGSVNLAMLLFAAAGLRGTQIDSIEAAHAHIHELIGAAPAAVFAIGLLASGIGSSVVGTDAGSGIMTDLVPWPIGDTLRRVITITPAVVLLICGVEPTRALVYSQLALSFGIAFALVPLVGYTSRRDLMGAHANSPAVRAVSWVVVAAVLALNVAVIATA